MIEAESKMVKLPPDRSSPLGTDAGASKAAGRLRPQWALGPRGHPDGWRKRPKKREKSM
jgi:hypothetical protein